MLPDAVVVPVDDDERDCRSSKDCSRCSPRSLPPKRRRYHPLRMNRHLRVRLAALALVARASSASRAAVRAPCTTPQRSRTRRRADKTVDIDATRLPGRAARGRRKSDSRCSSRLKPKPAVRRRPRRGRLVGRHRAHRDLAHDADLRSRDRRDVRGARPEGRRADAAARDSVARRTSARRLQRRSRSRCGRQLIRPADARRGALRARQRTSTPTSPTRGRCAQRTTRRTRTSSRVRVGQRGVAHPGRRRRRRRKQILERSSTAAHRSPTLAAAKSTDTGRGAQGGSSAASQPNAFVAEFQQAADTAPLDTGRRPGEDAVRLPPDPRDAVRAPSFDEVRSRSRSRSQSRRSSRPKTDANQLVDEAINARSRRWT